MELIITGDNGSTIDCSAPRVSPTHDFIDCSGRATCLPAQSSCRRAKLRCSTSKGDLVLSDPMTVARTFSSTSQRCQKAMKSAKETGPDPKTGKIKAISVDLT